MVTVAVVAGGCVDVGCCDDVRLLFAVGFFSWTFVWATGLFLVAV